MSYYGCKMMQDWKTEPYLKEIMDLLIQEDRDATSIDRVAHSNLELEGFDLYICIYISRNVS